MYFEKHYRKALIPLACASLILLSQNTLANTAVKAEPAQAQTPKPELGSIYFFSKVTPGVNIFSMDLNKNLTQITTGRGSRDIDMQMGKDGHLMFTSSRVLPEDRAERAKMGKNNRRQDINTYFLKPGENESNGKYRAVRFGHSNYSEAMAGISHDSQWLSFARTVRDLSTPSSRKDGHDEVYVQPMKGEAKKVLSDDVVIKSDWHPSEAKLAISHYNKAKEKASLSIYDAKSGKTTELLSNPVPGAQIDTPKWSPKGDKIAFIAHNKRVDASKGQTVKSGTRVLYVYDLKSKKLTAASATDVLVQTPYDWSSDGTEIVYSTYENYKSVWDDKARRKAFKGSSHIYISDTKGKSQRVVGAELQRHTRPVFSPDDSLIAYMYADRFPGKVCELRIIDRKGKLVDTLHNRIHGYGYLLWE